MKLYYDNNKINEIEYQIESGNPSKALLLSDEYIEMFPDDKLGPLFKARALACLNRKNEALGIVSSFIEYDFHDTKSLIMGYTQLANVYVNCDEQEKAIEAYKKAIDLENINNDFLSLKARAGLVNIYIKNKDLDEALYIIKGSHKKNNDTFTAKRAYIYFLQERYQEALDLLESNTGDLNQTSTQFVNYLKGRCLFALGKLRDSEEYYKKCLTVKNIIYYKSIYYLSCVYTATNRLEKALEYANTLVNFPDLKDNEIRAKFRVYLKLGYMDKAKELIDAPSSLLYRNYLKMKYYFAIKDYDKAIEYSIHVLNQDDAGLFNMAAQIYIMSYLKKGEFEYARYVMNYLQDDIDNIAVHQVNAYIAGNTTGEAPYEMRMYNCQQLVNYDEEKAIQHVIAHHKNNFESEELIRSLFDKKDEILDGRTCFADSIFDKYILPYSLVGFDEVGSCNTLVLVTMPESTDILTFYPMSGCEVYDEEEVKEKEIKRLSQTDKFYNRYGFK